MTLTLTLLRPTPPVTVVRVGGVDGVAAADWGSPFGDGREETWPCENYIKLCYIIVDQYYIHTYIINIIYRTYLWKLLETTNET